MGEDNLNRLITAVETGEHIFYHGDVREGVIEALKDLRIAQEQIGEIKDVLNID